MAVLLIAIALLGAVVLNLAFRRYHDPLKEYPGPYWASWTYLWRLKAMVKGMSRMPYEVELHRQYGDVVRTGPNVLTFADPQAVKDIYGTDKPYHRSGWYGSFATTAQGRVLETLFATSNTEYHDLLKRAVNPAFSLSALASYEPFVNNTIAEYIRQLETRFAGKPGAAGVIDLPRWMQWYAFDVVGELTYGAPFGFLRTGSDVDDIIANSNAFMSSNMVVSSLPGLDQLLRKNPVLLWLNRHGYFNGSTNPVVAFALKNRAARQPDGRPLHSSSSPSSPSSPSSSDDGRADLLLQFIRAKSKSPSTITEREVLSLSLSMIFAGSESTGTTLTAIFRYLLTHPSTYQRLRAEIDDAATRPDAFLFDTSDPQTPTARFREAFALPYLDACVKEVFRLHPAARFGPERVLPPAGARIAGREVPGGTVVAVNAWAVHRREDVFGASVEEFRPERWLVTPGGDEEGERRRVEEMNRQLFQFGAGKFVCIGRNISLMEMYKLVPSLMARFDFELADPEKEWRFTRGGFVNIADVDVRIRVREGR